MLTFLRKNILVWIMMSVCALAYAQDAPSWFRPPVKPVAKDTYKKEVIYRNKKSKKTLQRTNFYVRKTEQTKALENMSDEELEKAAKRNYDAAYILGSRKIYSGDDEDMKEGMGYLEKLPCDQYPDAKALLGYCYLTIDLDSEEALEYLLQAEKLESAMGEFLLARVYKDGWCGVESDPERAALLYLSAAKKGLPEAQTGVGLCLLYGYGVEQDLTLAKEWFLTAADNDDEIAKNYIDNYGFTEEEVERYWNDSQNEKIGDNEDDNGDDRNVPEKTQKNTQENQTENLQVELIKKHKNNNIKNVKNRNRRK